jgi:UDPglucose 6-dehydrogenase
VATFICSELPLGIDLQSWCDGRCDYFECKCRIAAWSWFIGPTVDCRSSGDNRLRVSVIGCGHVGLVTGACLAAAGHQVVCTDTDAARIAMLTAGGVPIYEPHLGAVLRSARKARRISFATNPAEAIRAGEAIFVCVETPARENGEADFSAIDHLALQIAQEARSPKLVIEKSAVPTRAGAEFRRSLFAYANSRANYFRVASNPEFMREGAAVSDFFHPDRIVAGVEEQSAATDLRAIYSSILERRFACPIHAGNCPSTREVEFVVTDIKEADLIKHASDSFLALKISYANVLADICEKIGADVDRVTRAMGLDPRIGAQFLKAGLGFGGFCFPNDVQAFIELSASVGIDFAILKAAESVNKERISLCLYKLRKALGVLKDKRVTVLGLAFKADTDDVRFSPALEVIRHLLEEGAEVRASDPEGNARTKAKFPQVSYHTDPYEAMRGADAAIICTDWDLFKTLDWRHAGKLMARKLVIDGRNLNSHQAMQDLEFEYYSFGRGTSASRAQLENPDETPALVEDPCDAVETAKAI